MLDLWVWLLYERGREMGANPNFFYLDLTPAFVDSIEQRFSKVKLHRIVLFAYFV